MPFCHQSTEEVSKLLILMSFMLESWQLVDCLFVFMLMLIRIISYRLIYSCGVCIVELAGW